MEWEEVGELHELDRTCDRVTMLGCRILIKIVESLVEYLLYFLKVESDEFRVGF